jgi:uncharacterized protein (DUF983 family)
MAAKCPKCKEGKLYSGFLTVAETCPICGLDLRTHDTGDGPAIFLIFIVGALSVFSALILEVFAEPAYWVHVVIWPFIVFGMTLGMLRPLKAMFVGIQYRRRSTAL